MTDIGTKIRDLREQKNISQESMAEYLQITQSNYSRLEKDDKRLTVPKVKKIAEVLKVSIAFLFDEPASKVIHQHNNDNVSAYNVENLYQSNKEITDKLIEQYEMRLKEKDRFIEEILRT